MFDRVLNITLSRAFLVVTSRPTTADAYLEPVQTSVIERFGKIVHVSQILIIFVKSSIIQRSGYASGKNTLKVSKRRNVRSETIFGNCKSFKNDQKYFLFLLKTSLCSQDI